MAHIQLNSADHCCAACAESAGKAVGSEKVESKAQVRLSFWLPLIAGTLGLAVLHFIHMPGWAQLAITLALCLFLGWNLAWSALKALVLEREFNENLLMSVAVAGAVALGDFQEAILVLILFKIGEFFEEQAVDRSRNSIAELIDRRPRQVWVENLAGGREMPASEVKTGSVYLVRNGDQLALDGVVVSGNSSLDTSALNGESLPLAVGPGDAVSSGGVNHGEVLRVRVTAQFQDSTLSRILRLVENSSAHKAKSESFIRRFARWYTPIVGLCALALALVPSLVLQWGPLDQWVQRALVFLVISCPCALVISVPLSYFAGIGGAAAAGILVKGGNYLDALGRIGIIAFDKTGTLTEGKLQVQAIFPLDGVPSQEIMRLAALAEAQSSHPIAKALWLAGGSPAYDQTSVQESPGRGIVSQGSAGRILVGTAQFLSETGIQVQSVPESGHLQLHVAHEDKHIGYIELADSLRRQAKSSLDELKTLGVSRCVMLSGDRGAVAQSVAAELGIVEAHGGLMPADKVSHFESLISQRPRGKLVAFVGDGINDAPVLARADLGIAMGGIGSDAALEAADVVLMSGNLAHLAEGIRRARKTRWVARQNIIGALAIKAVFLGLGAFGLIGIALAVFADTGTTVLAVLNSLRARQVRSKKLA